LLLTSIWWTFLTGQVNFLSWLIFTQLRLTWFSKYVLSFLLLIGWLHLTDNFWELYHNLIFTRYCIDLYLECQVRAGVSFILLLAIQSFHSFKHIFIRGWSGKIILFILHVKLLNILIFLLRASLQKQLYLQYICFKLTQIPIVSLNWLGTPWLINFV